MLRKNIIKKITALSCAFTVSLTGLPEINVNAQTTKVQSENNQAERIITKQGIVHTLATKAVSNESELTNAIKACPEGGTLTINLTASFRITKSITISGNKTVYINGTNGSSRRAIGTDKEIDYLFTVKNGASVTFSDIILKGGTSSSTDISYRTTRAVLLADGGNINLDNCKVEYSQGGLVNIDSKGNVSAVDTILSNSKGRFFYGGAVRIESGTFTMEKGTKITDNEQGGVNVSENATFTMNGGRIYGNKGGAGHILAGQKEEYSNGSYEYYCDWGMGGGVFCKGTFNFINGTIEGNSAASGGNGVVISSTGKMQVESGATLSNSGSGSNELWLYTSNVTFKSAPSVPMNTKVNFGTTFGMTIAKCSPNVSAASCMKIDDILLRNDPKNPSAIICSGDFIITLEPNGADGKKTITNAREYNSIIQLPTDYQKNGYILTGWKESTTGEIYESGSTQTVVADATYTAVWKAKDIEVKYYDSDGKTLLQKDTYNYVNQSEYKIRRGTEKTGYKFLYWKDSKNNNIYYENTSIQSSNKDTELILIAEYEEKNVTVNFNLNQPSANLSSGNTATVKYNGTLSLSSYVPSVEGYKFEGWYTNKSLTGSKLTSVSPAKFGIDTIVELYAKWDVMDVPVTYDTAVMNGTSTVKYDSKLTLPKAAIKNGYTFKGWYLNGNTSKVYYAGQEICPKTLGITSIKLSAIFEKNVTSTTAPEKTSNPGSSSNMTTTTTPERTPNSESSSNVSGWLTLNVTKKKMGVGDKFYIKAKSNEAYEISTDSSCITVNSSGFVKAIKPGTAVVNVKTPSVTKKCTITVKAAPKASNIEVKAKKVKKGKTISVKPTFTKNTYCISVTYSSSNKKVATVSKTGVVKGLKKGTTKITIKCSTGAKKVITIRVV